MLIDSHCGCGKEPWFEYIHITFTQPQRKGFGKVQGISLLTGQPTADGHVLQNPLISLPALCSVPFLSYTIYPSSDSLRLPK